MIEACYFLAPAGFKLRPFTPALPRARSPATGISAPLPPLFKVKLLPPVTRVPSLSLAVTLRPGPAVSGPAVSRVFKLAAVAVLPVARVPATVPRTVACALELEPDAAREAVAVAVAVVRELELEGKRASREEKVLLGTRM